MQAARGPASGVSSGAAPSTGLPAVPLPTMVDTVRDTRSIRRSRELPMSATRIAVPSGVSELQ